MFKSILSNAKNTFPPDPFQLHPETQNTLHAGQICEINHSLESFSDILADIEL